MGSTRCPGKVLKRVGGSRVLIEHLLLRLNAVKEFDDIIIATTKDDADDELYKWACAKGIKCFRGNEDNVLDRFYNCARENGADVIVRITADDPLKDPRVISKAIHLLRADTTLDYVSNTLTPTYPEGIDIEVFRFYALEKAFFSATKKSDLEHVTPYIWRNIVEFNVLNFEARVDSSHIRLTVDYEEDLEVIKRITDKFSDDPLVGYEDIVAFLIENPEIIKINGKIPRNEGYLQSTKRDLL
jgi:spore coat polysaccharide biosynthesis protein SpsF